MSKNANFEKLKNRFVAENEAKYGAEVRSKYGDKAADASNARVMGLTEEQYTESERVRAEFEETLRAATEDGDPACAAAARACGLHREWLGFFYSGYSKEYHVGLGEMYVSDERFREHYEKIAPGAAEFLRDAIKIYCGDHTAP